MSIWKEPKSNYIPSDEVTPEIFNELAENEKHLKEQVDTKITTDEVKDAVINNTIFTTRTNLTASEKLSSGFAKVRRWFTDIKTLAFKDSVQDGDIVSVSASKVTGLQAVATSGSYNDLTNKPTLGALASKDNITEREINGNISASKISGKVSSSADADISTKANKLNEIDSRDENKTPQNYMSLGYGQILEFKRNSIIGLSSSLAYSQVWTIVPWGDNSGGYPVQVAYNTSGMYKRYGVNETSWSAWDRILTANELGTNGKIATLDNNGEVIQNAITSTKATQDSNGNNIYSNYIRNSTKNISNGVAGLDANSKINSSQIPLAGSNLGGVKNGGNVKISSAGTMNFDGLLGKNITVTAKSGLGNYTNLDDVLNYISNVFLGSQTVSKIKANTFDTTT